MKDIFESHPVAILKQEISKTNIKGYSKMKKAEVIELMMKNKDKFSYIKMAEKKERKKPDKKQNKKAVEKKIKIKTEVKPEKKDKLKKEIKEAKQQIKIIKDDIGFFKGIKFKIPLKVSVAFNVLSQTQPDELNDNDRDMLKGIKKLEELNDERFRLSKIPALYYNDIEKLISKNPHIGLGGVIPKSQDKIDELTDDIVELKKKQQISYIKYKDADERYKEQLKAVEDLQEKYRKKTPKFTVRKGKKKAVKTTNLDDLIKKAPAKAPEKKAPAKAPEKKAPAKAKKAPAKPKAKKPAKTSEFKSFTDKLYANQARKKARQKKKNDDVWDKIFGSKN